MKMYSTIRKTAEDFTESFRLVPSTGMLDPELVLSVRTRDCKQSFGHTYFASRTPGLDRTLANDVFLEFVQHFFARVESATWDAKDILVDEGRRTATVRISCAMKPKGVDEVVENDMLFILQMDEAGTKIENVIEYNDPAAVGRLFALMNPVAPVAA